MNDFYDVKSSRFLVHVDTHLCFSSECAGKAMTYIESKGYCYGITSSGENLWPYAMVGTICLTK